MQPVTYPFPPDSTVPSWSVDRTTLSLTAVDGTVRSWPLSSITSVSLWTLTPKRLPVQYFCTLKLGNETLELAQSGGLYGRKAKGGYRNFVVALHESLALQGGTVQFRAGGPRVLFLWNLLVLLIVMPVFLAFLGMMGMCAVATLSTAALALGISPTIVGVLGVAGTTACGAVMVTLGVGAGWLMWSERPRNYKPEELPHRYLPAEH